MDCLTVRAALRSGGPTDPEILAHGAGCEACAALLAAGPGLARDLDAVVPIEGPDLAPAVMEAVRADRRRLSSRARLAVVAGGAGLALAGLLGAKGVHGSWRIAALLVPTIGAVAAVPFAVPWRGAPGLPGVRVAVALAVPPLLGLYFGSAGPGMLGPTLACLVTGVAVAGVGVALLRWTEPRSAPGTGWYLATAAAAGLVGALALAVTCPGADRMHLTMGHGAVGIVWALFLVGLRNRAPPRAYGKR